jgi:hypothetical protein
LGKRKEIDEDRFIEMYNAGYRLCDMCIEFDICIDTLRDRITDLGLSPRFTPVQVDEKEFKEAYFAGLNCRELAKKFKINRSRVATITRKLGLREKEIAAHRMSIEA